MTPLEERKAALRKRTKAFAGSVVRFYIALDKRREELRVLGKQILRSGTSVAANYREASRARSSGEFVAKWSYVLRKPMRPSCGSSCCATIAESATTNSTPFGGKRMN